ncbi:MAG: response regulator [Hyphomicrobiaceae bacterium]
MLMNSKILIVEDSAIVAWDLARAVEDALGIAVGPFATVACAMEYLDRHVVSGAILDVELMDRNVVPVAEELLRRGTPIVLQSGQSLPPALERYRPRIAVHSKLMARDLLVTKLAGLIFGNN